MMYFIRLLTGLIPITLMLSACNLSMPAAPKAPAATMPAIRMVSFTPQEAQQQPTRDLHAIATSTPPAPTVTSHPTESPYACGIPQEGEHIQHRIATTLNYASKSAQVAQQTRYRNDGQVALSEIVLDVYANSWEGAFTLQQLTLPDVSSSVAFQLDRNRLTIPLPQVLNPGCAIDVQLVYNVATPRIGGASNFFKGFFGYSPRQWNLALWAAHPAPVIDGVWMINRPYTIGEQAVLEQADWDVTISLEDAPDDVIIAAPGRGEQLAADRWQFTFQSARDFTMSLSPSYRVQEAITASGVTIEVYSFGDAIRSVGNDTLDAGLHVLEQATRSFEQYESLFGAYPYERFIIVMGDFPDGMEFSGLVYVGTQWFYAFEGGVQNYLTLITVHEVAHQWWYARVGNDAANVPWLDEALSTYSEYIYFEEYHPEFKDWWWRFRVNLFDPQGHVDSDIYQFTNAREYINAVYLRGVLMLDAIRDDVGTQAFFDLLAQYAATADGGIATPQMFWMVFSQSQLSATAGTRQEFLSRPDEMIANP